MKREIFSCCLFLLLGMLGCKSAFSQWMQLPQDTNNLNCGVCFINPDTGFIVGDYAFNDLLIQRTLDGGATWTSTLFTNVPIALSVCFPDDTTGYCGGQGGLVYKTTNMGTNWFYAGTVAPQTDFSTMYFTSRDTGFVADFDGKIHKTTNGGSVWNVVSPVQGGFTNFYPGTGKFHFLTDSIGFLADGNYGRVMKTIDAGNSWIAIDLPTAGTWAQSIYMFNKDTGIVTSEAGKIWRTVDGGVNWLGSWINTPYDLLDIIFFNDTTGYIVGGENDNYIFHPPPFPPVGAIIYVSYDAGATWHPDTALSSNWLTAVCDAGNNTAYTVGWHGWAYKLENANVNVGAHELLVADHIEIFPNPASGKLILRTKASDFSIELLDVSGRIVLTAENKKELDVSQLANGIYLLRLITGNGTHAEKILVQH
jgi:photosystem II stability/assembly factor-like uncharacterized protein